MTIQKAKEIIDIIMPLMINRNQEDRFYLGYSELKGYGIIDVDNALKLFNAHYYFRKENLDEEEINKLFLNVKSDNALLLNLCESLVPDQTIDDLNKYKYGSSEYIAKDFELVDRADNLVVLKYRETIESFLKHCISIGRDNPEYWVRVYYRLGLVYNPDDEEINSLT
jgi:hypothetical protein